MNKLFSILAIPPEEEYYFLNPFHVISESIAPPITEVTGAVDIHSVSNVSVAKILITRWTQEDPITGEASLPVAQIRVRSIFGNEASPWVTFQTSERYATRNKPEPPLMMAASIEAQASSSSSEHSSQYGQFQYNKKQYGELQGIKARNLEIVNQPIRIRNVDNGEYAYLQQTAVEGKCSTIRIRSVTQTGEGPWVYLEHKEV